MVDGGGRELGTIADLLVDTDGMVRKALVQPPEEGARPWIVDVSHLRGHPGQERGFVLDGPSSVGQSPPR